MGNGSGKTVLAWVGGGCVVVALLFLVVCVGGGYAACRVGKNMVEGLKDPVKRKANALEILGADALPEGYHTVISGGAGPFFKLVVLSQKPPADDGTPPDLGERGFIYFDVLGFGSEAEEKMNRLKAFFSGQSDDSSVLGEMNIQVDIDTRRIVKRGALDSHQPEAVFMVQRGDINTGQGEADGLAAIILFDCEDDRRTRLGIWFGPDPDPAAEFIDLDLTGTPADEDAVKSFIDHFSLCS